MTANLSSFLRFRFKSGTGGGGNEEQDLGGFDKPKESAATNYMEPIHEDHDEPDPPEQPKVTPTHSLTNVAASV